MKSTTTEAFDKALASPANYLLRLYVSGATPRSTRTIANIKKICEEHFLLPATPPYLDSGHYHHHATPLLL